MKVYFTLLLIACSLCTIAQEKKNYWNKDWNKNYESRSKFFASFAIGGSLPIQSPPNTITGSLMLYNKDVYLQVASLTCFVHKKWGFEINFKVNTSVGHSVYEKDSLASIRTGFHNHLVGKYGDRYFVSTTQYATAGTAIPTLMAGAVYKFTRGRLMFVPKLLFGINTFYFEDGFATLKEKNGNEIIDLSFIPKDESKVAFAISPGLTASYRLRRRLGVNIDLNYYRSSVSNSYTVTSHNYKSQEVSSSETNETNRIQWLNIGAGLSFLLK